ncbi:MAG: DUF262 domain-containing protein [Firmicutes bacterium]|nr:DUF262 domain-containing protein [Bacillota bacterium]MCL1953338.1 DUF262 domain-containing protein [Bacillota bacterium]
MDITKGNIIEFIARNNKQFFIPEFQRPYTWDTISLEQFLLDIKNIVQSGKPHYFGSIVYINEQHNTVIDGQQRLTTTLLFLMSIYHLLREKKIKSEKYTADDILGDYLNIRMVHI